MMNASETARTSTFDSRRLLPGTTPQRKIQIQFVTPAETQLIPIRTECFASWLARLFNLLDAWATDPLRDRPASLRIEIARRATVLLGLFVLFAFSSAARALETPCPDGVFIISQAYSECNPDGFWHVVQDDIYQCPDGVNRTYRVKDDPTPQPCRACTNGVFISSRAYSECNPDGFWHVVQDDTYRCPDGVVRVYRVKDDPTPQPCLALNSTWTGLQPFVSNNVAAATNKPLPSGGNGWTPVPPVGGPVIPGGGAGGGGGGIVVPPGGTVTFAFLNAEDLTRSKYFRIEIDVSNPNDIQCLDLKGGQGIDNNGKGVKKSYTGGGFRTSRSTGRYDEYTFSPQPAWERVSYQNSSGRNVTITSVKAWSVCARVRPYFNSLVVNNMGFGAPNPGVMKTNQRICNIFAFPKNIAVNPNVPPTFSAPPTTGTWTVEPAQVDPDGNTHPVGGVRFVTDGPGLQPGQPCNFSFAMQGPRADMQYTMYAFDATTGSFQEYNLDLRPALTTTLDAGSMFISWPAGDTAFVLETTANLASNAWTPVNQKPLMVGNQFTVSQPASSGMGFYRLVQASVNSGDHTPPTLSSVTPDRVGGKITLTFSEPVDASTATNLNNYYLADTSFDLLFPWGAVLSTPQSVDLLIDPPLVPGGGYWLGVERVSDLAGNVIIPATLTFTASDVSQIQEMDCNTGFGDDYEVCATSAEDAKTKAKAAALAIFKSVFKCKSPCYPHVSAGTAEMTGIECPDFSQTWKVHVDIICSP